MASNKDRTIQACRDLAEKYRNPNGKKFFNIDHCSLCKIHEESSSDSECRGCPLANKEGEMECLAFTSYKKANKALKKRVGKYSIIYPNGRKVAVAFLRRAEFFEKIIPILEKIPSKRFTKKDWTYFKELNRAW